MEAKDIIKKVDHTLLKQTATWKEIQQLCEDAKKYHAASVCIPPVFVKQAKQMFFDQLVICTVIGFPNGYMTCAAKCFETEDALQNGADEIDMVIPLGLVKEGKFDMIQEEIREIKQCCQKRILKVIIETCLLETEEKKRMCEVVTRSGADFIKTSTGFSQYGATTEDISLFRKYVGENVKIKAAGGIHSFSEAEQFLKLGASRLGTSRLISLLKQQEMSEKR